MATFVAMFLFLLFAGLAMQARPALRDDLVNGVALQALAYLLVTMGVLAMLLPGVALPSALGMRAARPKFFLLAALAGVAMSFPLDWMEGWIQRRWPSTMPLYDNLIQTLHGAPLWYRAAFALAAIALGPFVEEIFVRGALFRVLRRAFPAWATVLITALLFAGLHMDVHVIAPVFVAGLILGVLRWATGTLFVSGYAHAAFNSVTVFAMLSSHGGAQESSVPASWALSGLLSLAVLLGGILWLSNQEEGALSARSKDAQ